MIRSFFSIKRIIYTSLFFSLFLWFWFCLPNPLFSDQYATILTDRNGTLLSAKIADDGQWRFPKSEKINPRFKLCLIYFEDQYFYTHPGINLGSIWRAFRQNQKAGRVVSGGSTLTMQLMRLVRKGQKRSYFEKIIEIIMSFRVELTYSKNEILALYASHAPFGSNVVGLDAASWRYFGRPSEQLSWAECATLAVLPNAPSLIYPGKNQEKLLIKRNRLLKKIFENKWITEENYLLSLQEPLPQKPFPLPDMTRHLLNRCVAEKQSGQSFKSTLDYNIQERVSEILKKYSTLLKHNDVHNICALVLDVKKNEVISYIGNTPVRDKTEAHGEDVDVINSPRSTGSLLKPFLYGFMLNDGEILPNTLVPDIPTQIAGYTPQNFDLTYDGAVPAKRALSRSLNIPAVKMLQQYSIQKFRDRLRQIGLTTINRSADNYGLSLILGGAEGKLWDMCSAYASMARVLNTYHQQKKYFSVDWDKPDFLINNDNKRSDQTQTDKLMSAASVWLTFEAMVEVSRPDIDASWRRLSSSRKIAWKTGTSFGFRDGWAIGVTPDYVVGVWVGNADGEGRPGLTGISTAAPVLFEIFGQLPRSDSWFNKPVSDMKEINVCSESGCRASSICPHVKKEWIPLINDKTIACPYHQIIHLDVSEKYRVTDQCYSPQEMKNQAWFVLPPVQEYYYKTKNPGYKTLPPYMNGCVHTAEKSMEMIYPKQGTVIYIPVELTGEQGKAIFELAHKNPEKTIFWHLDGILLGSTKNIHQMAVNPSKGKHFLNLTDETGETLTIMFEVVSEKK